MQQLLNLIAMLLQAAYNSNVQAVSCMPTKEAYGVDRINDLPQLKGHVELLILPEGASGCICEQDHHPEMVIYWGKNEEDLRWNLPFIFNVVF